MTKVDAIEKVLEDNGGSASLQVIYNNIEKYYPAAKESKNWAAGLRGVLYRELYFGNRFKKIGLSIYALSDYHVERINKFTKVRRHSLMEGICIELGNSQDYDTFTADPSVIYRDNTFLGHIASISDIPQFSYSEIVNQVKYIDVLWFNKSKLAFPKFAFEIVDSIGTLNSALNRCIQLHDFRTKFYIVAPEEHRSKYNQTMELEIYRQRNDLFEFLPYDILMNSYERLVNDNGNLNWLR